MQVGEGDLAMQVHPFEPLADDVVMPSTSRLPHTCVPKLLRITMVRIDVVDYLGSNVSTDRKTSYT
jgi:hypothetical protein